MRAPVSDRGFTLLEMLIAITLVATIILIIAGAVRLSYRSVNSGERKMESLERFRASLTIIDAQIQCGLPLTYDNMGTKRVYFEGGRDSMRIATNYSIWGGKRGYVIVEYRVVQDQAGKLNLIAMESPIGATNKQQTTLLVGLDRLYFEYFFKDVTEEEGQWADQWTDETKTPQKIRMVMVSGRREISLIIPMRAEGVQLSGLTPGLTNHPPRLALRSTLSPPMRDQA